MKRYWDYTDRERATLTEEQVEELLAYELMEKGVLRVEPLKLENEIGVSLPTQRVYQLRETDGYSREILPVVFTDMGAAEKVRDALTLVRERDVWNGPIFTRPIGKIEIVTESLPAKDAVLAAKVPLEEKQRREAANAAERQRYEKETKAVAEATQGIWNDWRRCREDEARYSKIRATFAEYVRMTDGNETMALGFLAKAFGADEIAAALPEMSFAQETKDLGTAVTPAAARSF